MSGHVFVLGLLILPVPSQESERSCICVLGLLICLYQARRVSGHVFVC